MKLLSGGSVSPSGREPLHYENWKLWSGKTKGHGTALHTIWRKIKWQVIESLEELPAREKQ